MITWIGWNFQNPNTYMMELIITMHDYVAIFLVSVIILVFLSLLQTIVSIKLNMEFFENHYLEIVWTITPFILLVLILVPSLVSLYILESCNFCGYTIGVIGHQWYWSYDYKGYGPVVFDSYILNPPQEELNRLTDVDNRISVARHLPVRFLVRRADVIHSWTIPSFGFKIDAVPGRVNQFCTTPKRAGVFFGQCSEICGANHSFMPIVLEALNVKDIVKIL